MAYRLVDNMLYYTHDYTRTSIHTYNILQTCIHMHSYIQASTNPSPTSIRPYTHTPTYPGTHVRTYLSTGMYIQMYKPVDIRTYLGTGPDRSLQILKMAHISADMYIKGDNIQLQLLARRPRLSGGCGLGTLGAHEHVGWSSKTSTGFGMFLTYQSSVLP